MNNNMKFNVIEFFVLSFKDGLKLDVLDTEKLSEGFLCEFNHRVEVDFVKTDVIKKVLYTREFKCDACLTICKHILNMVGDCVGHHEPFEMTLNASFIENGD